MVLLLKQWKSRSSPGFAGGVVREPIHDVENAAAETISQRRFCLRLSLPSTRMKRAAERLGSSWRGVEQPGSSSGS